MRTHSAYHANGQTIGLGFLSSTEYYRRRALSLYLMQLQINMLVGRAELAGAQLAGSRKYIRSALDVMLTKDLDEVTTAELRERYKYQFMRGTIAGCAKM
jgi:hypothetical protein